MFSFDDLCADTTDRVLRMLSSAPLGGGNFVRPWCRMGAPPANASTGRRYSGANVLLLSLDAPDALSPWWATYRQWAALDRNVRKGQRSTHVVLRDRRANRLNAPLPGSAGTVYPVFAYPQTARSTGPDAEPWMPHPRAAPAVAPGRRAAGVDAWAAALGVRESATVDSAFWDGDDDLVVVPAFGGDVPEGYYCDLFHELVHWSGAAKRIARGTLLHYASADACRAVEELVAEMGAAMSCAAWGVPIVARESHAAFRPVWAAALAADRSALFSAAEDASSALRYLDNRAALGVDVADTRRAGADVAPRHLTF